MNSTSIADLNLNENNSTSYYLTLNLSYSEWLELFGYTKLIDGLYTFLVMPLGLVGLLSNSLAMFIISNKQFDGVNLFKYLRVYIMCNIMLSFIASISIIGSCRFLNFNSYFSMFIVSYFYVPLLSIFNIYSSQLHHLILNGWNFLALRN
jgi:hypothetical protein